MSARVRLRTTKLGKVRFLGHRDLARVLERALRRAGLPLARTQGFNPRAKLAFGLALPTGAESVAEYLEIWLAPDADVDLADVPAAVSAALPGGVDVLAAAPVDDREGSLQQVVTSSTWEVALKGAPLAELEAGAARALATSSLPYVLERKGVPVEEDLRPAILSLAAQPPAEVGGAATLLLELASAAGAGGRSVRPSEVVQALWPQPTWLPSGHAPGTSRVRRLAQWIDRDGERREPLALPQPAAVAAPSFASAP